VNSYNFTSLLITGFLLILVILLNYILIVEAQNLAVKINWSVLSNPIGGPSYAHAICETGEHIYIVGKHGKYGRIEIRYKINGALLKDWIAKEDSYFIDCVIFNGKFYVLDQGWKIWVFDLNLNLITSTQKNTKGLSYSIAFYDNYIYVAGVEHLDYYDGSWRVEKWKAEDLSFVKEYSSNPTPRYDLIYSIGINPITRQLWVIGFEDSLINLRVEILDLDLNLIKVAGKDEENHLINSLMLSNVKPLYLSKYMPIAMSVVFDEDGYAYVSRHAYIAKYDKYGNKIALKKVQNWPSIDKLLYANNYIYAAASELLDKYRSHVLYIFDKELNEINKIVLNRYTFFNIQEDSYFGAGKMAFDGKNLYIAGSVEKLWTVMWITYSLSFGQEKQEMIMNYLFISIIIVAIVASVALIFFIKRKFFSFSKSFI